jgi:hypothetical protein
MQLTYRSGAGMNNDEKYDLVYTSSTPFTGTGLQFGTPSPTASI